MNNNAVLAKTDIDAAEVPANQPRRVAGLLALAGLVLTGCGSGGATSPTSAPSITAAAPVTSTETDTSEPVADTDEAEPAVDTTDQSSPVAGERVVRGGNLGRQLVRALRQR
jgi:hypothetical protein